MKDVSILLVEDNKLFRTGVKALFESEAGFKITGEAQTSKEALNLAINIKPDIIILDIGLPDASGISLLKRINEHEIKSKPIILSAYDDIDTVKQCLANGAFAYVIKDISTDLLLHIVKSVYQGAMWLDAKIVPKLRGLNDFVIPQQNIKRSEFRNSHSNLTQREYEVLKLIVDGKSNNQIASELCISEHTAKAHVCNIIQKLVVDDRTQAAVKALKEGLVY